MLKENISEKDLYRFLYEEKLSFNDICKLTEIDKIELKELILKYFFHNKKKYAIEDLKIFAELNNGYCLSEKYVGSKDKYIWKCNNSHSWELSFGQMKRRKF